MFACNCILEHLTRGAIGIGALMATVMLMPEHPWFALLGIVCALVALRGCPGCS